MTLAPAQLTQNPETEFELSDDDLDRLHQLYRDLSQEILERACDGRAPKVVLDPHVPLLRALYRGRALGFASCGACFGMCAISTTGQIYPCHRFVGMEKYILGNVDENYRFDPTRDFFQKVSKSYMPKCGSCWARLICGGACYHYQARLDGSFRAPTDAHCERTRALIEQSIRLLLRLNSQPRDKLESYVQAVAHLA